MTKRRPSGPALPRTWRTQDGHTWVEYPDQRKRVDLGIVEDADLPAMIAAARQLPGPREVREHDAAQEAKRAQEAGETPVEDVVAGWAAQGLL